MVGKGGDEQVVGPALCGAGRVDQQDGQEAPGRADTGAVGILGRRAGGGPNDTQWRWDSSWARVGESRVTSRPSSTGATRSRTRLEAAPSGIT